MISFLVEQLKEDGETVTACFGPFLTSEEATQWGAKHVDRFKVTVMHTPTDMPRPDPHYAIFTDTSFSFFNSIEELQTHIEKHLELYTRYKPRVYALCVRHWFVKTQVVIKEGP